MAEKKLHVAIIMDGNGRWAKMRNLPRTKGHRAGIEALRQTLNAARELPIACMTFYSFSTENWQRPKEEVEELMDLLRHYLKHEFAQLIKNKIRFRMIGDKSALAPDIIDMIDEAEKKTALYQDFTLQLALNYGGRQEIVHAAQNLAQKAKDGALAPSAITVEMLASQLYTHGMPDPDLVIRTSGEERLSNFLIWQSAYSEFVFQDVLWPDYSGEHLKEALAVYAQRERRFGR
ncbi:MAG: isoprenyl transferase [Alphaproteobacteria bacterium]|nr:isoprenyl transferase [Alphaproteobacteria bacterium]